MPKRKLRIVKKVKNIPATGVCEFCSAQFSIHQPWKGAQAEAQAQIQQQFNAHKCKLIDNSQNALRVVREATENK